jgi:hypothetical protein
MAATTRRPLPRSSPPDPRGDLLDERRLCGCAGSGSAPPSGCGDRSSAGAPSRCGEPRRARRRIRHRGDCSSRRDACCVSRRGIHCPAEEGEVWRVRPASTRLGRCCC